MYRYGDDYADGPRRPRPLQRPIPYRLHDEYGPGGPGRPDRPGGWEGAGYRDPRRAEWPTGQRRPRRRRWDGSGGSGAVDRIRAADIMTARPASVTPDTKLSEVAARMRDLDVGVIPVVDGPDSGTLVGVITDRDIVVRAAAEGKDVRKETVRDHMTEEVRTVREDATVREIFSVMKRDRVRRVPVVDDDGRLAGIVAQADLAVDYAGLDTRREAEVEEVIERISEPAAPRRGWRAAQRYDEGFAPVQELGDRIRQGWDSVRRSARHMLDRGYDRGWR